MVIKAFNAGTSTPYMQLTSADPHSSVALVSLSSNTALGIIYRDGKHCCFKRQERP